MRSYGARVMVTEIDRYVHCRLQWKDFEVKTVECMMKETSM